MAGLSYTHDPSKGTYVVCENSITFEMNYSFFIRLSNWVKGNYRNYYTEESRGVYNWYREDLNEEERKSIQVEGLDLDEE